MPVHKTLLPIFGSIGGALPGIGTAITTGRGIRDALFRGGSNNKAEKRRGTELKFGGQTRSIGNEGFRSLGTGGSSEPGGCPDGFSVGPSGGCERAKSITGPGNCAPGTFWDPELQFCVSPDSDFGGRQLADQFGQAVMGRFGAGLLPAVRQGVTLRCPRGAVLGIDSICYNRKDIDNDERKWPRGRRPLLTGGDLNAITRANRAARRVEATTKRLQSMGMMKKPATRRALPRHQHAKQIAAVSV